ncbi:MAG: hypothetical protein WAO22_03570 [bacterium]|nr:hypothetical protein [Bacillota bacterium]
MTRLPTQCGSKTGSISSGTGFDVDWHPKPATKLAQCGLYVVFPYGR